MTRDVTGSRRTLDDWREPVHGLRIAVGHWRPLCRVDDQFIEPPRSLRFVWHYLKRIGPIAVLRKIRSRLAETVRNRKVAAVGTGIVLEAPERSPWRSGDWVVFFAPNHPEERRWMVRRAIRSRRLLAPGARRRDLPVYLCVFLHYSWIRLTSS